MWIFPIQITYCSLFSKLFHACLLFFSNRTNTSTCWSSWYIHSSEPYSGSLDSLLLLLNYFLDGNLSTGFTNDVSTLKILWMMESFSCSGFYVHQSQVCEIFLNFKYQFSACYVFPQSLNRLLTDCSILYEQLSIVSQNSRLFPTG